MNKLSSIILIFFTIIGTTCVNKKAYVRPISDPIGVYSLNTDNLDIKWPYDNDLVIDAIGIIIEELNKEGLFSKNDMYNALNGTKQLHLENNHDHKHKLVIKFTTGLYDVERKEYCIKERNFEDQCLYGWFDAWYHIKVIPRTKIYNSSLAHELFHYFRRHIDNVTADNHKPKKLWARLFGYHVKGIGSVNEAIKKKYP